MKLTDSQEGVLAMLASGFPVNGKRYNEHSKFFRAECEELPKVSMATLNALHQRGLIVYEMDGPDLRLYSLTELGLRAAQIYSVAEDGKEPTK